jgi:predicted ABC-type transport system involved in lysophospholipase L1 biosynthesis ATPase subunit
LLELTREEGKSLVLVTHNPEFAQRTERQLTLHLGQLR